MTHLGFTQEQTEKDFEGKRAYERKDVSRRQQIREADALMKKRAKEEFLKGNENYYRAFQNICFFDKPVE